MQYTLSILPQNNVPQASWFWRACSLVHFSNKFIRGSNLISSRRRKAVFAELSFCVHVTFNLLQACHACSEVFCSQIRFFKFTSGNAKQRTVIHLCSTQPTCYRCACFHIEAFLICKIPNPFEIWWMCEVALQIHLQVFHRLICAIFYGFLGVYWPEQLFLKVT